MFAMAIKIDIPRALVRRRVQVRRAMLVQRKDVDNMAQTNTEGIARKKKHGRGRWMPRPFAAKTLEILGEMLRLAGRMLPAFLLVFADLLSIPSGLHAAYMTALGCLGESLLWPACGWGLSLLMRLVWGLPLRLETLVTLGLTLLSPMLLHRRGMARLMGWTAVCLLPMVLRPIFLGTAAEVLLGMGAMVVGGLSAPVFLRAVKVLGGGEAIDTMEERVAVGYLCGMLLCGGGRMLLFLVNVGVWGAAFLTLCAALFLGVGAGTVIGMMAGIAMAMQGLPIGIPVALALGGFSAGMAQALNRRWLTCLSFALGSLLALLLCGATGYGCAGGVVLATLAVLLLPRDRSERLQRLARRFLPVRTSMGDGYAASALASWEHTVDAMAKAVPSPMEEEGDRTCAWWKCRLCEGCPDDADCACMLSSLALHQAEAVWKMRGEQDESWRVALENLRGLGCGRLYFLRERMDVLRREDKNRQQENIRLGHQRDMLVTHLQAMAGAARHFAQLSAGATWWDDVSADQLRRVLAEMAYPASLLYARRVQGHARVCLESRRAYEAENQADELCAIVSRTLELPMTVGEIEGDRITLMERPLWQVVHGVARRGVDGRDVCGDTALCLSLGDGRFLAALSDGMGHGEQARKESRQTVELLRLCLDAGYTRQQSLTAVNGMMLLSSRGERFSTVDLVLCDLWTGQVTLDKMGAAASWLIRGREMTELTGDALPLGVLEQVESRSEVLRVREGDQLILMTDGVEDAFDSREALRDALIQAADEPNAQDAAHSLLLSADKGEGAGGHDDRTVAVLRFFSQNTVQTGAKTL